MIPPGSTVGIIGGGQLGRMLSMAAAELGFRSHIYDPHARPCAADVAFAHSRGAFDDRDALGAFAESVDIVTYEFENVPVAPLEVLAEKLRPGVKSLAVAQDRAEEKAYVERCGARLAPWHAVATLADVEAALATLGAPVVLKTRRLGYDGKGQAWAHSDAGAAGAWSAIGEQPAVAEAGVSFVGEFSVIVARGEDGVCASWDVPHNEHRDGILRRSTVPAPPAISAQAEPAKAAALALAGSLDHVGVLTVEFFATAEGPLVNEIAPRVHNSGHWTIEGAVTSQFAQHIRAICGLPLGSTALVGAGATMDNLIGDDVECWPELIADPNAHVHLYAKGEARPGRKMGHVTRLRG